LPSTLHLMAVPIGNAKDITLNVIHTMQCVDALICEERKIGAVLLKGLGLSKPIHLLNEHSSSEEIRELFHKLFIETEGTYALISDAGTPCFADPGAEIVGLCYQHGIKVNCLPGASSLMAALMLAGKRIERFYYYGFLNANRDMRLAELKKIKSDSRVDYFFLEAPYRLKALVEDMTSVLGSDRKVRLFYRLTYPDQRVIICNLGDLRSLSQQLGKGEFVLLLEAR